MTDKLRISVIVDNPNSWMVNYAKQLALKLKKKGHEIAFSHDHKEVLDGDCAFFLSCEKIVTKEIRKRNRHNIVIHESDLPKGRGWSPMTWQVLEGARSVPLTLFEIDEKVDDGCYYIKDSIRLEGHELIEEIREKQAKKTEDLIMQFLENLNGLECKPQQGEPTFYKKRTPADSQLDVNKPICEQFNLLRVVDNDRYPAFFILNGHEYVLKIYKKR